MVVVVDGRVISWKEPTGGGPYSAIAASTMDADDTPSARVVSGRPPRYMPSAAEMSVDV